MRPRGFSARGASSLELSGASGDSGAAAVRFSTSRSFFAAFFACDEAAVVEAAEGAAGGMATFRAEATDGFGFAALFFSAGEDFAFASSRPLVAGAFSLAPSGPPEAVAGFAFAEPVSTAGREVTGPVEPATLFAFFTDLRFVATRALQTRSSCRSAYSGAMTSTPPM